ncbi:glycosyltransferase family 2 protein [Thiomonas sp. FB-6]|uniref:glycosyltransferase family 2 protein n=1 Tax=Thiomonas sp. FB-6 TaxID=1158291 RepID=UPI0018CBA398|nr:glycosyltransferase family 2 protein [Thiomonas sp. FB-6]
MKISAVVVTYNRCTLLTRCLDALARQSLAIDQLVLVDNASTDSTATAICERVDDIASGWLRYSRLPDNLGGAGGFEHGMREALRGGADWVWLMDDDAEPSPDALECLFADSPLPGHVYASVPQRNGVLAWPVTWNTSEGKFGSVAKRIDELPPRCVVQSHPFLGFLIHRELIERIGVPDGQLYISADDIEYSLRARAAGATIVLLRASSISHPVASSRSYRVLGRSIPVLSLPPWRRYYDTRNRLLVARRHHGRKLWTQALPGTLARMLLVALHEPRKKAQFKAAAAGLWDGLRGISGKRHTLWDLES